MEFIISEPGHIRACARAAAHSYGKDTYSMTCVEVNEYVKKIWDRHTNVGEHFVQQIEVFDVPRIISLIMEFQRDVTFTEFSQRRRKPAVVNQAYEDAIAAGEKKEDARKHLSVLAPTNFAVTVNREGARNIARILQKYQKYDLFRDVITEYPVHELLAKAFMFELDDKPPLFCPDFHIGSVGENPCVLKLTRVAKAITLPMYSFHELVRHRKMEVVFWRIHTSALDNFLESSMVEMGATSLHWNLVSSTRSGPDVQEPLRTLAKELCI